jgi:hypothetical protein
MMPAITPTPPPPPPPRGPPLGGWLLTIWPEPVPPRGVGSLGITTPEGLGMTVLDGVCTVLLPLGITVGDGWLLATTPPPPTRGGVVPDEGALLPVVLLPFLPGGEDPEAGVLFAVVPGFFGVVVLPEDALPALPAAVFALVVDGDGDVFTDSRVTLLGLVSTLCGAAYLDVADPDRPLAALPAVEALLLATCGLLPGVDDT